MKKKKLKVVVKEEITRERKPIFLEITHTHTHTTKRNKNKTRHLNKTQRSARYTLEEVKTYISI